MKNSPKYSTFQGVFIPSIVTILGAILYLRHGWLVGNGGLLGAVLIILLCKTITTCTALSLSSIASNTRLLSGGAYAIISRSLGKETGAAIGLMLYLAQSMAIVLVIFGFREGWLSIFPSHSAFLVDILCFFSLISIVLWNTGLALRLQIIVFILTILSVLSVSPAPFYHREPINWLGSFSSFENGYRGFWQVFGIFFPAVTGILAGSSMSGELANPRISIPRGTLAAVVVSAIVYLWLAFVFAASVPQAELLDNYNIMAEISLFPSLITISILGACFCAGLATLVGAPRILHALAMDNLIPYAPALQKCNAKNEPQNALLLTSVIVFLGILLRDLNLIAPLITICFLSTYGTINFVVLLEQKLELLSFRPALPIPAIIPFIGAAGSMLAMLIINPTVSLIAFFCIIYGYIYFSHRFNEDREDVRTNLFLAVARWAVRKSIDNRPQEGKVWMPHPLIPVLDSHNMENLELGEIVTAPSGSLRLLCFSSEKLDIPTKNNLFYQKTRLSMPPQQGILFSMETFQQDFFQPNILILSKNDGKKLNLLELFHSCRQFELGLIYHSFFEQRIPASDCINVWIRPQNPHWDVTLAQKAGNLDLALLLAIQLSKQKRLHIRLLTTLISEEEMPSAQSFLDGLAELGRLPENSTAMAFIGDLWSSLPQAPSAKIHIFGLPTEDSFLFTQKIEENTDGLRLFIRSSGKENLLA